jgi:hypothetical protein
MIGMIALLAAGQMQPLLARNDERRWQMFIRASLQAPDAGSKRMRDLSRMVRSLHSETMREPRRLTAGPLAM